MTRLTKSAKETIVTNAMDDIFKTRREELLREESLLVQQIVKARAVQDQDKAERLRRELREKIEQCNKELGQEVFALRVEYTYCVASCFGKWHSEDRLNNYLNSEGEFVRGAMSGKPTTVSMPVISQYGTDIREKYVTPKQSQQLDDFFLKRSKLRGDESKMKSKLSSCLESVTTVKRLIETYPDLEKYVPISVKGTGVKLAVPPAELMAEMAKMRESSNGKRGRRAKVKVSE